MLGLPGTEWPVILNSYIELHPDIHPLHHRPIGTIHQPLFPCRAPSQTPLSSHCLVLEMNKELINNSGVPAHPSIYVSWNRGIPQQKKMSKQEHEEELTTLFGSFLSNVNHKP